MTDATVIVGEDESLPTLPTSEGPLLGTRMGRYIVLSTIGTGAMGVVVVAYDPELDRKAALKLIRPRRSGKAGAQARLWREAQALAKLNHPNVVTIYDVGTHDDQVFVAMELVPGQTLRQWMGLPRSWREVLRVFEAAGRGLAAAHEVGMVHRDFKPDNVMIGDDGRVRVMDFGLARAREDPAESEPEGEAPLAVTRSSTGPSASASASVIPNLSNLSNTGAPASSSLGQRLTQTGMMLGTPAYMAPEQWRRQAATPRSDQFSFCVALFEALYGRRPFAGASVDSLAEAVGRGVIVTVPRGKIPAWLRRALIRGLATDPSERYASMNELLAALAADPALRRRRSFAAIGVVGLLGAAVWAGSSRTAPPRCADMQAKLAGTWDDERRLELQSAILATEVEQAGPIWARVEQGLDAYADAWVLARTDACEASSRGEQSGALLDRRMGCLDARLDHLRATVDELGRIDGEALRSAEQAVIELPTLERCADTNALLAELPPPEDPEVARAVAALEGRLVEIEAKRRFGRYADALAQLEPAIAEAERLGHSPSLIRARLLLGNTQLGAGEFEAAVTTFEQVYFAALAHAMPSEAAEASAQLIYVLSAYLARFDVAKAWVPHAEATAQASGRDEARARYLGAVGRLAWRQVELPRARELFEAQLDILVRIHGPEHLDTAKAYFELGNIIKDQRELGLARAHYERALAIRTRALGEVHPSLVTLHSNLGLLAIDEGKLEQASASFARAIEIGEATLGPEHFDVLIPLFNLGHIELERRQYASAQARFERALKIFERTLGPDHPHVGACYNNLAQIALEERDDVGAEQLAERALAIKEKALGPTHPALASTLDNLSVLAARRGDLARAHVMAERSLAIRLVAFGSESSSIVDSLEQLGALALLEGKPDEAREYYGRGLALREAELGDDHPDVARSRWRLGEALVELGLADEALRLLEQAREPLVSTGAHALDIAALDFVLARALAASQPEAARKRVEQVREVLHEAGIAADPELVAKVDAWLTAPRG